MQHLASSRVTRANVPPSRDTGDESSEHQPLIDSDGAFPDHRSVRHSAQWERHVEPSLATVQPQAFQGVIAFRQQFLRQILGLNPFKTSYFALYKALDDAQSRTILVLGILLAICAGIPLRT